MPCRTGRLLERVNLKYPYHRFMANCQKSQHDSIRENLPLDHVLYVHDYSENCVCSFQEEIKSQYFHKNEASLHLTILHI